MERTWVGVSLAVLLLVIGCGSDKETDNDGSGSSTPEALCKSEMADACSKVFHCHGGEEAFVEKYGTNEAECRTMLEQKNCGSDLVNCGASEKFSASKASECLSQVQAVTCEQYLNKTNEPTACEDVCM